MTARAAALVAAAFVLCAGMLSGCVAVPPPGPTQADLDAYQVAVLERSWLNTGLEGAAPFVAPVPEAAMLDTFEPVSQCFIESGVAVGSWGYGGIEGYSLDFVAGGGEPSPEDQRAFYICVASNPYRVATSDVLSSAQIDYVYDYYRSWVVPCLLQNHYGVTSVLSREEFAALNGMWNPYLEAGIETSAEYDRASGLCGPQRPPLE